MQRCPVCGAEIDEAQDGPCPGCLLHLGLPGTPAEGIPSRVGSYRPLEVLGEGAFGIVYLAEQDQPRRRVALKLARPDLGREGLRRFEREAELLGRLRHPGIAQIFEAGTDDAGHGPQPYIAMEWVEGLPLNAFAEQRALSTRQRLELFLKICDAVAHAHECGVLHRDLKPSNLLVTEQGEPKVLDFGIARTREPELHSGSLRTSSGQILGTIPYMSPEQVSGDRTVDSRSDVYALGVVLYELLTGRLPLAVDGQPIHRAARTIVEVEPPDPRRVEPSLAGDIATVLLKALQKSPAERYASVSELADDLRNLLADRPVLARPPSWRYRLARFGKRHRTALTSVVVAASAVALALAFAPWQHEPGVDARIAQAIRDLRATRHGEPDLGARSAAIHELGLMADEDLSREYYRAAIAELALYIRENLSLRRREGAPEVRVDRGAYHIEDIRAALVALKRLHDRSGLQPEFMSADFSDLSLIDLDLSGLDFSHCNFDRSFLSYSDWTGVHFDHASLRDIAAWNAVFRDASFYRADLAGAKLAHVDFTGARLNEAADLSFSLCASVRGLPPDIDASLTCDRGP